MSTDNQYTMSHENIPPEVWTSTSNSGQAKVEVSTSNDSRPRSFNALAFGEESPKIHCETLEQNNPRDIDMSDTPSNSSHQRSTSHPIATANTNKGIFGVDEELKQRDLRSINDYKSRMLEGEVKAYVKHPQDITRLVDFTGHSINEEPQLHEASVLAANVPKLTEQLGLIKQKRVKAQLGLLGIELPAGVVFLLNLVPDTEGEAALEALHKLSCPLGILHWESSRVRVNVSSTLVSGRDDIVLKRDAAGNYPDLPELITFQRAQKEIIEKQKRAREGTPGPSNHSNVSSAGSRQHNNSTDAKIPIEDDYSQARHRSAILKLLQLIEGVDIVLDSAPKLDRVVSWMTADPNSHIIELLPECSWKIGMALGNEWVGKPAWTVLVGDEALSIASRMALQKQNEKNPEIRKGYGLPKTKADLAGKNQFGRTKDPIDEDSLSSIQYAAQDFYDRIQNEFDKLTSTNPQWYSNILEIGKCEAILKHVELNGTDNNHLEDYVGDFMIELINYVRGRILKIFADGLAQYEIEIANKHRKIEQYLEPYIGDFNTTYDGFSIRERVMIRFPWRKLFDIVMETDCTSRGLFTHDEKPGRFAWGPVHMTWNQQVIEEFNLKQATMLDLTRLTRQLNNEILIAIGDHGFNDGKMPEDTNESFANNNIPEVYPDPTENPDNTTRYSRQATPPVSKPFTNRNLPELSPNPVANAGDVTGQHSRKADLLLDDLFTRANYLCAGGATGDSLMGQISSLTDEAATTLPIRQRFGLNCGNVEAQPKNTISLSNSRDAPVAAALGPQAPFVNFVEHLNHPLEPATPSKLRVPDDHHISPNSPFINLTELLKQMVIYIQGVSREMLNYGPLGEYHNYTDTLSCLKDELRYLLSSCGGLDDETGAVFNPDLPPENKFLAPNAPGPFYTTGYSAVSAASTDCAMSDTDYSIVNGSNAEGSAAGDPVIVSRDLGSRSSSTGSSSLRVENSHIVISEDGIQTEDLVGNEDFLDTAMPGPESESSFDLMSDSDTETECGTSTLSAVELVDNENLASTPEAGSHETGDWEFDEENEEEAFDYGDEPVKINLN